MSGDESKILVRDIQVDGGGEFQVTTSCSLGMVNVAFDYFDGDVGGHDKAELSWLEDETYSGTTFGFSTQLTKNVHRWVPLRIRLDQQVIISRSSSSKFRNEAEVVFYDPDQIQRQAQLRGVGPNFQRIGPPTGAGDALTALSGTVAAMTFQLLPALMPSISAGTVQQLLRTNILKVEIPLADRRRPVVIFNPRDASFRDFLATCGYYDDSVSALPGGTGGGVNFEGTYDDGMGDNLTLSKNKAFFTHAGQHRPPVDYTISGNIIQLRLPSGTRYELTVSDSGMITVPDDPEFVPMRRVN